MESTRNDLTSHDVHHDTIRRAIFRVSSAVVGCIIKITSNHSPWTPWHDFTTYDGWEHLSQHKKTNNLLFVSSRTLASSRSRSRRSGFEVITFGRPHLRASERCRHIASMFLFDFSTLTGLARSLSHLSIVRASGRRNYASR